MQVALDEYEKGFTSARLDEVFSQAGARSAPALRELLLRLPVWPFTGYTDAAGQPCAQVVLPTATRNGTVCWALRQRWSGCRSRHRPDISSSDCRHDMIWMAPEKELSCDLGRAAARWPGATVKGHQRARDAPRR